MLIIAKRDLLSYFTSPLGYLYVTVFTLVMNLYFYIMNVVSAYSDLSDVFGFMLIVILFSTPMLTMRSLSEERKQKTDQLLLTSPIKTSRIVLGKFIACLSVFLAVILLSFSWTIVISIFGKANLGQITANYISIISAASLYISLGIFISSLTENQLVAAVGSLGVFIALYLLEIASYVLVGTAPKLVISIMEAISIFRRYDEMRLGIFSIADIVFYLSVTAFFLFLSTVVFSKRRQ